MQAADQITLQWDDMVYVVPRWAVAINRFNVFLIGPRRGSEQLCRFLFCSLQPPIERRPIEAMLRIAFEQTGMPLTSAAA